MRAAMALLLSASLMSGARESTTTGQVMTVTMPTAVAPLTICFWVRPNTGFVHGADASGRFFQWDGTNFVYTFVNTSGVVDFIITHSTTSLIASIPAMSTGVWKFVAMRWDGGLTAGTNLEILLGDETTAMTEPTYGATTNGVGTFTGGTTFAILNNSSANRSANARIAQFMVFPAFLTDAQLNDVRRGIAARESWLKLAMTGVDSPELDGSGNGRNATLTGSIAAAADPPICCRSSGFIALNKIIFGGGLRSLFSSL